MWQKQLGLLRQGQEGRQGCNWRMLYFMRCSFLTARFAKQLEELAVEARNDGIEDLAANLAAVDSFEDDAIRPLSTEVIAKRVFLLSHSACHFFR